MFLHIIKTITETLNETESFAARENTVLKSKKDPQILQYFA